MPSRETAMPRVTLEPMTEAQFAGFMDMILPAYVAERAAADHVAPEAAERHARAQHARLLPEGCRTRGHEFFNVVSGDGGQTVGGVWISIDGEDRQAFLYNITIFPQHRRRGWAGAALALVGERVRAAGCNTLGLNVFSSNAAAIALYRKSGFQAVSGYWNRVL